MSPLIEVRHERVADTDTIDQIVLTAFGPGVFTRAAFRVRETASHDPRLSFVVERNKDIIGSVRLTWIDVGGASGGMLLGPLVVDPDHKNCGHGRALVHHALDEAEKAGVEFVILVGDMPYYGPLGFEALQGAGSNVRLPGPIDPARLLVAELRAGAACGLSGLVRGIQPRS